MRYYRTCRTQSFRSAVLSHKSLRISVSVIPESLQTVIPELRQTVIPECIYRGSRPIFVLIGIIKEGDPSVAEYAPSGRCCVVGDPYEARYAPSGRRGGWSF